MLFHLVTSEADIRQATAPGAYLIRDNWNDWFKFKTMYALYLVSIPGSFVNVGSVKIGQKGMNDQTESPAIPELPFETLDDTFFSVGQSEDYYETLNQYPDLNELVYSALRDCAYYPEIFLDTIDEYIMGESVLRSLSVQTVRGRLSRLARGNAELTHYSFAYCYPSAGSDINTELTFDVIPTSTPPTNVHVLIGRNGVGKTRCLSGMIGAILGRRAPDGHLPGIFRQNQEEDAAPVANLIAVSFSAFDPADPLPFSTVGNRVSYSYVGLKTQPPKIDSTTDQPTNQQLPPAGNSPKDSAALAKEFADSMQKCQEGLRKARWRKALRTLETDPLFHEAEVASFAATDTEGGWRASVMERFKALSSGHAIVLLTITRLVELVEERSLVLIDEPEGHLHPPLLSAFVRALSDLLVQRNGVAIVATHSPVVLQEVPKSCVWLLSRSRLINRADRPEIETFGENVGVLTREVFGLEVIHSGFLALIDDAITAHEGSYEAVLEHFGNQLGAEGRAIARGLCIGWTPGTSDELGHEEGE